MDEIVEQYEILLEQLQDPSLSLEERSRCAKIIADLYHQYGASIRTYKLADHSQPKKKRSQKKPKTYSARKQKLIQLREQARQVANDPTKSYNIRLLANYQAKALTKKINHCQ